MTDCYLPRLGGIELSVHDLAVRQADAGHDVTVITSTVGGQAESPPRGTVVRLGGPPLRLRGASLRLRGGAGRAGHIGYRHSWAGRPLVAARRFDVVHLHASSFSPLSFVTARQAALGGVPTVVTVHSLWGKATTLFQIADWITGWAGWPIEWSAVSNAAAAPLHRILAGRAPVAVLANGIDPEAWQVAPVPGRRDELRIAVVGRLAPRKRTLHLARVLLAVRRRLPASSLLRVDVVGDGPERRALERFLDRHSMRSWVHVHGRLDRRAIRDVYARSDLFVAPGTLESFGIAALEARCSGLPIVALTGTGTQDFVTHGVDGWLADSDEGLGSVITRVALDRRELDTVAEHNRRVAPPVTWQQVLRRCETLYSQAAARRCHPESIDARPDRGGTEVIAG